ncbi:MAG: hypothetical protein LBN06_00395 [Prevotellaceae bacterium]|jgi:hypothetical protein|nr:hypothetical protein [Prevotellaceae bacterium]
MKRALWITQTLFGLLVLVACSGTNRFPSDYIGFEKSVIDRSFEKGAAAEGFDVKIIAAEKSEKDREVVVAAVNPPGRGVVLTVEQSIVVIPAKKKSVMVPMKIYPSRINGTKVSIRVVCKEKESANSESQMMVNLSLKKE